MARLALILLLWPWMAAAQALLPGGASSADAGEGASVELTLSLPTPWRVRHLDGPRVAVEWRGPPGGPAPGALAAAALIEGARLATPAEPGWSRLELTLAAPAEAVEAGMTRTGQGARIALRLAPVGAEAFAALATAEPPAPEAPARRAGRLRVVIDPGHGGRDPGAVSGDLHEADIVLAQARALREALLRTGRFDVEMTRDADVFVSLTERLAAAAGADVFLSIHADSLAEGTARGATVYTYDPQDADAADRRLIERYDAAAMLGAEGRIADEVAGVLADLRRAQVAPRSDRLGDLLVTHIGRQTGALHKRPRGRAAFLVLGGVGGASALVEIGYLQGSDVRRLTDPGFRRLMAAGIADALLAYAAELPALEAATRN